MHSANEETNGYLEGTSSLPVAAREVRANGFASSLEALAAASRLIDSQGDEPMHLAMSFRQAPENVSCSFVGADSPFPVFLFWSGPDAIRIAVLDCSDKCMEQSGIIADSEECMLPEEVIARVMKVMGPIVGNNADNLSEWLGLVLQGMLNLWSTSL